MTLPVVRRRYRRIDWLLLRWQARLDASWADRVVPWIVAGLVFVVYLTAALARADRLEGGVELARSAQAVWQLAEGRAPETTVGGDLNYLALRLPLGLVPLAAVTRFLPTVATLLAAQAAALALGVVPVWHLARKVANLRIGATAALVLVYAVHPAVAGLDLADFHPAALAVTPLLVAAYAAERKRWTWFAVASVTAVSLSSELGLVIAVMGVTLMIERERRIGSIAVVAGLAWVVVAVFAVQGPLGTGLVDAGAFEAYGDTGLEVLIEMVRNPFRPVGDILTEENLRVTASVLGPLLFLPLLSLRKLAPALPLQALYFVADAPLIGPDGGGRTAALVAFAFVAAPAALAKLGRRSIERVLVDRGLLTLLLAAGLAALLTTSPLAPHAEAWRRDGRQEEARRAALAAVPPVVSVRVPEPLAPELAERRRIVITAPGETDPERLTAGVDALVLDESTLRELDEHERFLLRRRIEDQGFLLLERAGDIDVFLRRR